MNTSMDELILDEKNVCTIEDIEDYYKDYNIILWNLMRERQNTYHHMFH